MTHLPNFIPNNKSPKADGVYIVYDRKTHAVTESFIRSDGKDTELKFAMPMLVIVQDSEDILTTTLDSIDICYINFLTSTKKETLRIILNKRIDTINLADIKSTYGPNAIYYPGLIKN